MLSEWIGILFECVCIVWEWIGVLWQWALLILGVHWYRRALGMNLRRLTRDPDAARVDLCALGMNWHRR